MERRDFLKAAVATTLAAQLAHSAHAADATTGEERRGDMIYRPLGRTGIMVSALGLGGYHIGVPRDEQAGITLIRTAIDRGINFMDNSWDYHAGNSEVRMGKALKDGYRDKVFLMTKIDGRTKASAAKQIDECLSRLEVETIDLMQHHEIIRMDDADRIFAEGGAHEACLEAQQAGKIRFIGFTGHKDPLVHLRAIDVAKQHGVVFDTVQMPLNVMDAHFRSFEKEVVPVLMKDGTAVLGMKSMGSGAILKTGVATPAECLRYALSLPTSTVIAGMENLDILEHHLDVVKHFTPYAAEERAQLLEKTAQYASRGEFEKFKTTDQFDATAHNPAWLG